MQPPAPQLLHIEWHPDAQTLRRFGLLASLVFGVLAFQAWPGAWPPVTLDLRYVPSLLAAAVGCVALTFAVVAPRYNRALYVTLSCVTYPIGVLLAWTTLLCLFFLVITPVGWLARRVGRGALRPFHEGGHGSAWLSAQRDRAKETYFRQF